METNIFKIKNFLFFTLLVFAVFSCKNEDKKAKNIEMGDKDLPISESIKNESSERKIPTGVVEVTYDGETTKFTDFDPNLTTDVTYLKNGIQFVITSTNKQAVLVNMYAPDFFKKIPITISQQTYALEPKEVNDVKTQSRLNVTIPTFPEVKRNFKVLYKGSVTLNELSENKLVITFSGTGLPLGDSKDDFFPFEGKIVLENFNVYDFRL